MDIPLGRWVRRGRAEVFYVDMKSLRHRWGMYREVRRTRAKVLYLNSLMSFHYSIVPLALQRARLLGMKTVVVAPRGELDSGALSLKAFKKAMFLRAAQAVGLHTNVLWHASSEIEAESIRHHFPTANVLVKENETLVRSTDRPDKIPRQRQIAFAYLGRVSKIKRVHTLIKAASLVGMPEQFTLTIHGGGDSDYLAYCKQLAIQLGVDIAFSGPIQHEDVAGIFDTVDYACFATSGENFGHVVGEAMARGCPVLIGDVTPWTEHVIAGGGEIISEPGNPHTWARTMRDLIGNDSQDVRVDRRRAALASFESWNAERDQRSFLDLI